MDLQLQREESIALALSTTSDTYALPSIYSKGFCAHVFLSISGRGKSWGGELQGSFSTV